MVSLTDSPYRTAISGAVLKMQEDGQLHELKEKWWKKMHGGGSCDVSYIHSLTFFEFNDMNSDISLDRCFIAAKLN